MKTINEQMNLLKKFLDMLEEHFGEDVEVVLHDLSKGVDHSIVDIRNKHVTNREIGDCGDNLGLEVLRGTISDGDRFNYVNHTKDGKILRSSSIFMRDDDGMVIGCLCINQDITASVEFEKYLNRKNKYTVRHPDLFTKDVGTLLEELISQASMEVGKHLETMTKDEKLQFLRFLDERGAFLISKSTTKVCNVLGISKFTLYNYLETIREESGKNTSPQ